MIEEFKRQLEKEGFKEVYEWEDVPNAFYSEHEHDYKTVICVVEGEIEVTMNGEVVTAKVGNRVDIPEKTKHSAKAGPEGCFYVVGEESNE